MSVRVLVDSVISGRLIGKGGATVRQIRQSSAANIDIANTVRGASKRIVTVKGSLANTIQALYLMAECLADKDYFNQTNVNPSGNSNLSNPNSNNQGNIRSDDDGHVIAIVLLVHNAQVGCIIGRSGETVRDTRQASNAQVTISEHTLEGSMEKTVTIKGGSQNVKRAIERICHQLAARQDRSSNHNLYIPRPAYEAYQDPSFALNPFAAYSSFPSQSPPPPIQMAQYSTYQPPTAALQQTIIVPVPENMIGCVIGKRGATIREIRLRSHAQITIADSHDASERMITISGTRQANELAVALVYEKMAAYDPTKLNRARGSLNNGDAMAQ